jgi:glucose-6-phosphate isomerase
MEFNLTKVTRDTRKLNDIASVIYDKAWLKNAENFDLYYMYRGLEEKDGLRYDITITPAKMLGQEFVKTKGHYHAGAWQEAYIVLNGKAIYLMQKIGKDGNIEDVYAVKAIAGNVVIIPPFYGHVTINPSKTEELKMANWVSKDCKSDYSLFEKQNGACYFYLDNDVWQKNLNYQNTPELRFESPDKLLPEDLSFLKNN